MKTLLNLVPLRLWGKYKDVERLLESRRQPRFDPQVLMRLTDDSVPASITAALSHVLTDSPLFKKAVDKEIDRRFQNATKLTQEQLQ